LQQHQAAFLCADKKRNRLETRTVAVFNTRLLDRALALAEPVDGGVEFVLIDGAETKNVAET